MTHYTAAHVAALRLPARMEGLPICPPNEDAEHEAECRRLDKAGDARAAAGAYCRIQNPARQKRLEAELWGFV